MAEESDEGDDAGESSDDLDATVVKNKSMNAPSTSGEAERQIVGLGGNSAFFSFRDAEESLETFSADDNRDVRQWIREFESMSELLGWSELQMLLFARRMLRGSAKLFISSEGVIKSWRVMKESLISEFGVVVNSAVVHRLLRERQKTSEETFRKYVYAMIEIAKQADVDY